jgi:hypothetical protein
MSIGSSGPGRHVARAVLAAAVTAVAFVQLWMPSVWSRHDWPASLSAVSDLTQLALTPFILPAAMILSFVGVRGGPDGMPRFDALAVTSFLLCWGFLELAPSAWRRLKVEMKKQGGESPFEPR